MASSPEPWNLEFVADPKRIWAQFFSITHEAMWKAPQPEPSEGKIHRIFNQSNFSRQSRDKAVEQPLCEWLDPKWMINDRLYSRIRPALVLATRLLEESSEFFNKLAQGKIEVRNGKEVIVLDKELEPAQQVFPTAHDFLHSIQFFTGYSEKSLPSAYATTCAGWWPRDGWVRLCTVTVQLNTMFTTFFTHHHYDEFDAEIKSRTTVNLAVTLVHELVHVWFMYIQLQSQAHGRGGRSTKGGGDPRFTGLEPEAEIGFSWEVFAFGGMLELHWTDPGITPYVNSSHMVLRQFTKMQKDKMGLLKCCGSAEIVAHSLVDSFLDRDCWDLFRRLRNGDLHAPYATVAGKTILDIMETVVFMRSFEQQHGGHPLPTEISRPPPIWIEGTDTKGERCETQNTAVEIGAPAAPEAPASDTDIKTNASGQMEQKSEVDLITFSDNDDDPSANADLAKEAVDTEKTPEKGITSFDTDDDLHVPVNPEHHRLNYSDWRKSLRDHLECNVGRAAARDKRDARRAKQEGHKRPPRRKS